MSNISKAQISGKISIPFSYPSEQNASLSQETLSIIGTAETGPAFVPQQIKNFNRSESELNTWENLFGSFQSQQDQIGPLTANTWLSNNGEQLTYTRVLGIGNGEGLNEQGEYTNAGFVVGDSPTSGSIVDGVKGPNKFTVANGDPGRTHFFGSYYENLDLTYYDENDIQQKYVSPYSDYIEQITGDDSIDKIGIITDVVFATSGSIFYLQDEALDDLKHNQLYELLSTTNSSENIVLDGNVTIGKESKLDNPKIYLQGQIDNSKVVLDHYNSSNKYLKTNFFENNFNTTPDYHLHAGNLCYANFRNTHPFKSSKRDNDDVKHFVCTGDNVWNQEINTQNQPRVNFESFECIYKKAKTPWVVSQPVYRQENFRQNLHTSCKKLFRFHSCSDGKKGNKLRFRIKPRRLGDVNKRDREEMWSKFDLILYIFDYQQNTFNTLYEFLDLNLDPKSENYIGKRIGTEYEYYDLDLKKVCHKGFYKKTNNYFYVEIDDDVEFENNETDLMPSGFFPYPHINISNSNLSITDTNTPIFHNPIQFVSNMKIDNVLNNFINYDLDNTHWGIEFSKQKLVKIKNVILTGESSPKNFMFNRVVKNLPTEYNFYHNYTKYFQDFKENKFWVTPLEDVQSDTFNDFFHLEKVLYLPEENTSQEKWNYSFYRRDGKDVLEMQDTPDVYDYVNIDEVLKSDSEDDAIAARYLSFDFFTYGGFDGLNILDENKRKMNGISCLREFEEEVSGTQKGQTTYAYEVAKDIALDLDNFRCDIFSIPGINIPDVTKEIVDLSKENRKFIYLFDAIDLDSNNRAIKNNYYFNNLNNNINDIIDENDIIKSELIDGTNNSFDNHMLQYYNSEYSISTINLCEAVIEDTRLVIPSSLVFINSLSQSSRLVDPIDSINYTNSPLEIVNPINSKFLYYNNDFDDLLLKSKKKTYTINPIGVISSGKQIKPLSANTLLSDRKNLFSLFYNVRIFLDIKRNLKNLLISSPILNGETVLFSLYSESNIFSNTKSQIEFAISDFFEEYKQNNLIEDYLVDLSIIDQNKSKNEKFENIITGKVAITFIGNRSDEDFIVNLRLDNLINNINDFTQENNISIINISN